MPKWLTAWRVEFFFWLLMGSLLTWDSLTKDYEWRNPTFAGLSFLLVLCHWMDKKRDICKKPV